MLVLLLLLVAADDDNDDYGDDGDDGDGDCDNAVFRKRYLPLFIDCVIMWY